MPKAEDAVELLRARIAAMAARLEKVCNGHGRNGRVDSCADCHQILEARRLLAALGDTTTYDDVAAQTAYQGWDPRMVKPR